MAKCHLEVRHTLCSAPSVASVIHQLINTDQWWNRGKIFLLATSPETNPTWTAMRLTPVLWGESSAATNVKYVQFQLIMFVLCIHLSYSSVSVLISVYLLFSLKTLS
jgi:hypothetical protein